MLKHELWMTSELLHCLAESYFIFSTGHKEQQINLRNADFLSVFPVCFFLYQ